MKKSNSKELIYSIWFKILLILITFAPLYTQKPYNPADTSLVIADILKNPLIVQIDFLLPLAKLLLLAIVLAVFFMDKAREKLLFAYYGFILIPVSLFQNMGHSSYGFSVIIGNIAIQIVVIAYCFWDLIKAKSKIKSLDKSKLWVIPLMLLAFLMPYEIVGDKILPSLKTIFTNEAGLTYCMITPVIEGILIIFHKEVHKASLNAISFVGLNFAIWNMLTWFVFDIKNYWMGILHFPLLILSIYGLVISKRRKNESA